MAVWSSPRQASIVLSPCCSTAERFPCCHCRPCKRCWKRRDARGERPWCDALWAKSLLKSQVAEALKALAFGRDSTASRAHKVTDSTNGPQARMLDDPKRVARSWRIARRLRRRSPPECRPISCILLLVAAPVLPWLCLVTSGPWLKRPHDVVRVTE